MKVFFFQRYHLSILIIIFNDRNQYKNCLPMKLFKKKKKRKFSGTIFRKTRNLYHTNILLNVERRHKWNTRRNLIDIDSGSITLHLVYDKAEYYLANAYLRKLRFSISSKGTSTIFVRSASDPLLWIFWGERKQSNPTFCRIESNLNWLWNKFEYIFRNSPSN